MDRITKIERIEETENWVVLSITFCRKSIFGSETCNERHVLAHKNYSTFIYFSTTGSQVSFSFVNTIRQFIESNKPLVFIK